MSYWGWNRWSNTHLNHTPGAQDLKDVSNLANSATRNGARKDSTVEEKQAYFAQYDGAYPGLAGGGAQGGRIHQGAGFSVSGRPTASGVTVAAPDWAPEAANHPLVVVGRRD
ncbi:hypothetical protein GCM10022235_00450 [Kribbella ginsengisoli]|uniref:Uncharacterized protein n=1 Tax=Kribbella ginsengisoli TaxID=363865 RepID=A0ABP6VPS3_9ACTN